MIAGNDETEYLFLNGELIDSAKGFSDVFLDDFKKYSYIRYNAGNHPDEIVLNGEVIYAGTGYKRLRHNSSGKYCFQIDDNNIDLIFNNRISFLQNCPEYTNKNSNERSRLKIYTDFGSFIDVCNSAEKSFIVNCNDNITQTFDNVYFEVCDSLNNFSFFGVKDYYLYSVTNGVITDTLSKKGIRGKPVYISPQGRHIFYYNIGDSVYFYMGKNLFKVINKNKKFHFELYYGLGFYNVKDQQYKDAKYLTIEDETYVLIGENLFGPYFQIY